MTLVRGSGFGVVGVVCLGVTLLGVSAVVVAQEVSQERSRKPASGWATKKEKDANLDAVIEEKLKRILANQQTILQKADVVKQELGIIKIRATGSGRTLTLPSGTPCP